jgi:hypothetical protein
MMTWPGLSMAEPFGRTSSEQQSSIMVTAEQSPVVSACEAGSHLVFMA